jgi:hypothetical protein
MIFPGSDCRAELRPSYGVTVKVPVLVTVPPGVVIAIIPVTARVGMAAVICAAACYG